MSTYIDLDGIVVDEDTGEVIDAGTSEYLAVLASKALGYDQQIKTYERARQAIKRVFMREQEGKSAVYGDVVVSIPAPGSHMEFDGTSWASWVDSAELTTDDMRWLLAHSRPDYAAMPPGWQRDLALQFFSRREHSTSPQFRPALKPARVRVVEREEEVA